MKKLLGSLALFIMWQLAGAQKIVFPVIQHYGGVYAVPYGDRPDSQLVYNIIIEAGAAIDHPDSLYAPFEHIARMYNLHVFGGVPRKNLHMDVVIFSKGVLAGLNNEAYRKRFGVDNPNLQVIREMKEAGINLYACGQSVTGFELSPSLMNSDLEVVLSRATTVSTRQMKGYAFFKF